VVVVHTVSSLAIRRTYNFPDSAVSAATESASLAWGRHLVEAVAKCQECHEGDLGGKMMLDDPAFSRLATANLTSGRGGTAGYTDADFERAIRHGVGRDGRPLVFMPSDAYGVLTDGDLAAMLGYLRTFPPVDREHPDPKVGPVARLLYLTGKFPLLPVEITQHNAPRAPRRPEVTVEYGEYLGTIGGCRSCHGPAARRRCEPRRAGHHGGAARLLDGGGLLPRVARRKAAGRQRAPPEQDAMGPERAHDR
jgi:mono/diheme cytochrome c family protein